MNSCKGASTIQCRKDCILLQKTISTPLPAKLIGVAFQFNGNRLPEHGLMHGNKDSSITLVLIEAHFELE